MKMQMFNDGNKRTAVIFSNHYLISKGKGIIAIPAELAEEFKNLVDIIKIQQKNAKKDDDKCHRLFVKEVVSTYCKFRLYLQVQFY